LALIVAGITKSKLTLEDQLSFQDIMLHVKPYIGIIGFSGIGILAAMLMIFLPQLKMIRNYLFKD